MKAWESLKMCSFLVAGLVSHRISFPFVTGWEESSPQSFTYLDSYLIEVPPSWNQYIVQSQQRAEAWFSAGTRLTLPTSFPGEVMQESL